MQLERYLETVFGKLINHVCILGVLDHIITGQVENIYIINIWVIKEGIFVMKMQKQELTLF